MAGRKRHLKRRRMAGATHMRANQAADGRSFDIWRGVNWTARSLIAAGGLSVCVLMTALSASASVERAEERRAAEAALADEAQLVAEFAEYLARETETARADFAGPRVKPARAAHAFDAGPDALAAFVNFDFNELNAVRASAEDRRCLAEAIYFEAGSQSRIGQLAIADVILNRVAHPAYPSSICGVVYEGSTRRTGCQFTFTCDGSLKRAVNRKRFEQAEELAGAVLAGLRAPVSRNATHYHADYVSPSWAATLTPTATIGAHKFYRFPRRVEVAEVPATM